MFERIAIMNAVEQEIRDFSAACVIHIKLIVAGVCLINSQTVVVTETIGSLGKN